MTLVTSRILKWTLLHSWKWIINIFPMKMHVEWNKISIIVTVYIIISDKRHIALLKSKKIYCCIYMLCMVTFIHIHSFTRSLIQERREWDEPGYPLSGLYTWSRGGERGREVREGETENGREGKERQKEVHDMIVTISPTIPANTSPINHLVQYTCTCIHSI